MSDEVMEALLAPFDPLEVKWKPAVVSGNRAMALAYVDARVIMDRLDDVLGVAGWQDSYEILSQGSVVCKLRLKLDGEWVEKQDVGSPSEQSDEGDRMKAAFSDSLKRAAVKFGISRYLYRLPSQWVEYDPQKKRFVKEPRLPEAAIRQQPRSAPKPQEEPTPELVYAANHGMKALEQAWERMTAADRKANQHFLQSLKKKAAEADNAAA